jgi:hypothetical protein
MKRVDETVSRTHESAIQLQNRGAVATGSNQSHREFKDEPFSISVKVVTPRPEPGRYRSAVLY